MFTRIFLAASLAVSAAPSFANGSMGQDVRIIVVNPSPYTYRVDRIREMEKRQAAERKYEAKSQAEQAKSAARRAEQADKAYYKKLEAGRKAAAKKRK